MDYTKTGNPNVDAINKARAENVAGGVDAYYGAGATPYSQGQTPTITSDSLASTKAVSLPTTPVSTTAEGINGLTTALAEQSKTALAEQAKANAAQTEVTGSKGKLEALMDKYINVQSSRADLEKNAGIDAKAQAVTNATNQIEALDRAQTNELRALEGSGLGQVQIQQKQQEINRRYAFQKADQALIQSAANRDLATAQSLIDNKIKLALEPLQTQLDFTKLFYEDNKTDFTKAEDRAFQTKIATDKQAYESAKSEQDNIGKAVIDAIQNGAPADVIARMNKAGTYQEAVSAGSQYIGALDRQIKQSQIAKNLKDAGIGGNPPVVSGLIAKRDEKGNMVKDTQGNPVMVSASEDPFVQSLIKTSGGGKLTDTTIQKLDKGLTVLSQLGILQTNIQDLKTGPITGAFRGANPWDTNAQTIRAQLNAIVPNLARGVYGEVGVLTDNDIKTYSQTLPNLKSTEEVRNAVLYITLDMIGKSIKNTLSVNAAAKRDVSGFVDIYTEMEATKDAILSTIPGAQVPKAFQNGGASQSNNLSNDDAYALYLQTTGQQQTKTKLNTLGSDYTAPTGFGSFGGFNLLNRK